MKITKRQLRRIIKEEISHVMTESWAGTPSSIREWTAWSETFGLSPEYDNDGQLIFYLSHEQPDRAAIAADAVKAGASVDTDYEGNDMIYTGMTDMGPM
jgi:hypothetical protein